MSAARSVLFVVAGKDDASKAFLSASKSAEAAAVGMDRSVAKMNAASTRLHSVGQKMSKAITLPIVAAVGVAVDQAVKYQKAMTLLQTAGGESAAKMTVISKGLMTVAKDTGTSLHDLSEGMYTVAKAGSQKWSATDQLIILRAAAQGAKAENVDLGTATNALTSILMSYHLGAKDAVAVQNELIIGAGKAKTTMQEYAGSLSTVVPIASAAGINFAQVGGAIATLTQHGTSAMEATQELANTIRGLQAPNHVAIVAMNQLGLNANDVSKNLGKRGLTGTIDLVTTAISKHLGPSGLVVVDAFKKSQSATADLSVEIGKMPVNLAKLSQGLLTGKTTRAEYLKSIKGMSLENNLLGRNFITTAAQAMGFNNLLKSGSPAAQTFAAYLKSVMGGATGLNTALQLGGENMAYFKTATHDVGAAAKGAGKDVLGWAKTQETAAVKMDKLKATAQVLSVEVGNALIPALTGVVKWLTGAVQWFDGLSGGAKKFIGYSILVVAALGPLFAIAGRVGKAFALMWAMGLGSTRFIAGIMQAELSLAGMETKSYLTGLKLRSMFSGGISGARAFGSALGGAAIGVGVGLFTQHMSTTAKAIGAVASTALGAAQGFSVGGPVGAAIGAGVGLLSNLATNLLASGKAAHAAVKPVDEYTQAILRDNQALGTNVRAVAAARLGKEGAFDTGRTAGVTSSYDITSATLGNQAAKARVVAAEQLAGVAAYNKALATLIKQRNIVGKGNNYALAESDALAGLTAKQRAAVHAAQALNDQIGIEAGKIKASKQAAKDYADATSEQGKNDKARAAALKALNKAQDTYNSMVAKGGTLAVSAGAHGISLDPKKGGANAAANIAAIHGMEAAANRLALSQILTGKSLDDVNTGLDTNVEKLRTQAIQLGYNSVSVSKLIDKYKLTPKQIVTYLQANISKGTANAESLQHLIDSIKQNHVPGLKADSKQANAVIQVLQARIRALTGQTVKLNVTAYWSASANRLLNILNGNNHAAGIAASRQQAGGTAAAYGQRTIPPNSRFTVGEGASHTWEYGESDASGRVSIFSNAQSRAMGIPTPTRYASGTGGAPTGQKLSDVVSAFAALKAAAHNILATAQELSDAAKGMRDAAKAAGASSSYLRTLATQSAALVALGRQRDSVLARLGTKPTAPTAYDRLATAQGNFDTAKGSGTAVGAFDVTTAGTRPQLYNDRPAAPVTAGSILSDLAAKVRKAQRFTYLIKRMIQLGLPKSFVEQFVAAGPDAATQAEALIKASPAQLSSLRGNAQALDRASAAAGLAVANKFYKPGVDAAQGLVNGLLSQESALNAAIKRLGDGMVAQLKRTLHIKSPSRVMHGLGVNTAEGYRLGIASKHDAIDREGKRMAEKITRHHHGHGQHSGPTVINHNYNMTVNPSEKMDEHQIAAIASRRMAALVY